MCRFLIKKGHHLAQHTSRGLSSWPGWEEPHTSCRGLAFSWSPVGSGSELPPGGQRGWEGLPGRLAMNGQGRLLELLPSLETGTGLSQKLSLCVRVCASVGFCFSKVGLFWSGYLLFFSFSLLLERHKVSLALITGASRDISPRPGRVGGGGPGCRCPALMSPLASAPRAGWSRPKSLPVARDGFQ